jgi:hypothetical protein
MTAFLHKSKASILELMKLMPDAHIAEEEDFVVWGGQFVDVTVSRISIEGVDVTDADFSQNTYYAMSYRLGCMGDDVDVKKAVNEVQEYYNV